VGDDKHAQIASLTTDQVIDAVHSLLDEVRRLTIDLGWPGVSLEMAREKARAFAVARRHLGSMVAWREGKKGEAQLARLEALFDRVVKSSVVDEAKNTVTFIFSADDVPLLRRAMFALIEFQIIKTADAERAGRGKYKGKR